MAFDVASHPHITVPMPVKLGFRRGLTSLSSTASPTTVRIHDDDLALLDAEAALLGLTRGEFIRWMCVYCAAAVHKQRTGKTVQVTP